MRTPIGNFALAVPLIMVLAACGQQSTESEADAQEFTVARREKFTASVGGRFIPGIKLHVLASADADILAVARELAAAERQPLTVFFWSQQSDIGKTAANHSVDCLEGPTSCRRVF